MPRPDPRHWRLWWGIVVVESTLDPWEYSDPEDRAQDPVGEYHFSRLAPNWPAGREKILDTFHRRVPIGCLDDFTIRVRPNNRRAPLPLPEEPPDG